MAAMQKVGVARTAARVGVASLAAVWLLPAAFFNVDWSVGASIAHNTAAVGMIAGSALLIHVALARPTFYGSPVLIMVALFLIYGNTKQAVRNLSLGSEALSEAREARMAAGSQVASQRSRLEARRLAAVATAGEVAPAVLEAAMDALRVSEPQRWRLTNGCAADKVTTSADFCLRYANAKAKVAAATEREKIDVVLANMAFASVPGIGDSAPKVADPYTANVISLLGELGLRPTERIVVAEEAISRALGLELLAGFGPACWLIFLSILTSGPATVPAAKPRLPTKRVRLDTVAAPVLLSSEPPKADAIDRWIADQLEFQDGAVVLAKQLRTSPGFPKDIDGINENTIWARLRATPGVKHDPNSGRPRYFGVRIRQRIALVSVAGGKS